MALDHRELGPVSLSLDYTWQQALGNSSDPQRDGDRGRRPGGPAARLVSVQLGPAPHLQHDRGPGATGHYSLSAVLKSVSGQPYTPVIDSGFGNGLDDQLGPQTRAVPGGSAGREELWASARRPASVFLRVFNLFDTRYFNGSVFTSTGSPYYSRFPAVGSDHLADPTRFYPPRRIEIGLTLRPGAW